VIRLIYNLAWPIGLLFFLPGYLVKMFRRGGYGEKFGQRLGLYDSGVRQRLRGKRPIWFHAVSVGEVAIALKLAREWKAREPDLSLVLTTTTTTGFSVARRQFSRLGEVMYMPLDFWPIMRRGFRLINPAAIVLVEAEVWPNLMAGAKKRGIPVALVNARLSPRSEARFRRFRPFVRPLFRQLALISVAESEDLGKWAALGADRARLKRVGSVKFDSEEVEEQMAVSATGIFHLSALTAETPVLLGGSTHHGEEDILADVFMRLRLRVPRLSLFLAPRHVERAREIRKRLESRGLEVRFVSEAASDPGAKPHCIILDQTGQLPLWYSIATVAFVGKSLTAHGGQNPIEPIAAGVPVIFGPNMENFARLAKELIALNGAVEVHDAGELRAAVERLLEKPETRASLVANAEQVLARHRGATGRTVDLLEALPCRKSSP
jgi:3-deoxy-D-manno-octulosonic-acid transferase